MDRTGIKWSKEETILAFDLYCRTSFGKISSSNLKSEDIDKIVDEPEIVMLPEGRVREQLVKNRVGQYFFRMAVLNSYENRCCITGLAVPELLVASHIKPWKDADSRTERTNPMNGLTLNALHDKAFDRGLITVTPDYIIKVSSQIKPSVDGDAVEDWLLSFADQKIRMPNKFFPRKEFLEFHNDVVFKT